MDVGLAPIIFILMVSTTAVQSQITKGPANALKKVGDSVMLECVTSSKNCDQVEWKKMEGAQSARDVYRNGVILDGFSTQRYNVTSTGGCRLTITQLNIIDSGRFSCVTIVGDKEETRSSVLVVISVRESCRSNLQSNALNQNDGYSFSTAINVPAKSVEPSNVTLSFQNKTVYETEATDNSQSQTVNTTLTGIARNESIMQRVCRASFTPNSAANFDRTAATLNVCTTQQLIVSYPVENIAVLPPGPYHNGTTVRCTANGYPFPTFKWTRLMSGAVVDDGTLAIKGEAGDQYTCTATNTFKGKTTSLNITIEVVSPPSPPPPSPPPPPPEPGSGCGPACVGIIVGCVVVIVAIVVALLVCCFVASCPLYKKCCQ